MTSREMTTDAVYYQLWKNPQPVHTSLIMQMFGLKEKEGGLEQIDAALEDLIEQGRVVTEGKRYRAVGALDDLMVGKIEEIEGNKSYDRFVPNYWPYEHELDEPILIRKGVNRRWPHMVHITRSGEKIVAKAIQMITPSHPATFTGRVTYANGEQIVKPIHHRKKSEFKVSHSDKENLKVGDIVVAQLNQGNRTVRVLDYDLEHLTPERLTDMIILDRGLPTVFSSKVAAEADALADLPPPSKRVKWNELRFADQSEGTEEWVDYTELPVVTIDPENARDHDDGIIFLPDIDGYGGSKWKMIIPIADVPYYVQPHTSEQPSYVDLEAYERGNSFYFPDRAIPMLPASLSSRACSLRAGEEKMVKTCEMRLDDDGRILSSAFRRGVMKGAANLTYDYVDSVFNEVEKPEHELRHVLENLRMAQIVLAGAPSLCQQMVFDVPSDNITVDDRGVVHRDSKLLSSTQLIANASIMTNALVGELLHENGVGTFRNHDAPDDDKMEYLVEVLASKGFAPPYADESVNDWQKRILMDSAGTAHQNMVNTLMLRAQTRAYYAPVSRGHYGLGLNHYSHFTSPIRRYPDLEAHRGMEFALPLPSRTGKKPTREQASGSLASSAHFNERSRLSQESQWEAINRLGIHIIATRHIGQKLGGRIHRIKEEGITIETDEPRARGFLSNDALKTKRRGIYLLDKNKLEEGDYIAVYVESADPVSGELRFSYLAPGGNEMDVTPVVDEPAHVA